MGGGTKGWGQGDRGQGDPMGVGTRDKRVGTKGHGTPWVVGQGDGDEGHGTGWVMGGGTGDEGTWGRGQGDRDKGTRVGDEERGQRGRDGARAEGTRDKGTGGDRDQQRRGGDRKETHCHQLSLSHVAPRGHRCWHPLAPRGQQHPALGTVSKASQPWGHGGGCQGMVGGSPSPHVCKIWVLPSQRVLWHP